MDELNKANEKEAKKNRVLIVDDDRFNIMALINILSPEYTVYAAKDGKDAIRLATEHVPDLILLDVVMPQMDGFAVLAELKQFDNTKDIPVVFVTSLDSAEDEEKGLSLGASDYISKPLSPPIVKLRVKNQIQIVNQMRIIERLSTIDPLTNIPNRRSFDDQLRKEWARAIRNVSSTSVLMLDIDNFKDYNDDYGHLQGDVMLRSISDVLIQALKRPGDFAARWGGEEFIALLTNTDSQGARHVAEKIRKQVENLVIPFTDGSLTNVTVSIGTNTHIPVMNSSIDKFISRADMALYTAKGRGRNRVCQYWDETGE